MPTTSNRIVEIVSDDSNGGVSNSVGRLLPPPVRRPPSPVQRPPSPLPPPLPVRTSRSPSPIHYNNPGTVNTDFWRRSTDEADELRRAIAESLRTTETVEKEVAKRAESERMPEKQHKRRETARNEPEKVEVVDEEEPTDNSERDQGRKENDDSVFSAIVLPFVAVVFLLGLLGTLVKGGFMLLYEFLVYATNVNVLPFKALYYRSFGRIFAARGSMPRLEKKRNEDKYTTAVKKIEDHNKDFIKTLRRRLRPT